MRVSSEETLRRAAIVRESGKSWMELTRSKGGLAAGLDFFSGAKPARRATGHGPDGVRPER